MGDLLPPDQAAEQIIKLLKQETVLSQLMRDHPQPKVTWWQRLRWRLREARRRVGFWIAGVDPHDY